MVGRIWSQGLVIWSTSLAHLVFFGGTGSTIQIHNRYLQAMGYVKSGTI